MPHTLSVEPAAVCNLHCPECPVGKGELSRPQGILPFPLFKEIVDQTADHLLHLILYFQGEPFLAPEFFRMVAYAKAKGLYVSTSTNGHYLDRKTIPLLLDSGLDRLIVSLDGATQESYMRYRVGGNLQRVEQGVAMLVRERNARGMKRPYIILQTLLLRHLLPERETIRQRAAELGADRLEFKTAQFYDLSSENLMIPDDPRYSRYVRKEAGSYRLKYRLRNRCPRLWSTAVMTWDGRVLPCCFDKDAEHEMGRMPEERFRTIWRSGPYQRFREQILRTRAEVEMCRNCTEGLSRW